jgi:exopolyphosphatase/guanosine-5'-triphosphate,3'-diphosphate pyrophosphatase
MRLAAIDIGTNSIHMIVVQVRPDLSFEVIDREKDMVRLGAGGLDGKNLTHTATAAALTTLSKFKRLAESHKVEEIIAGATSAVREAENGGDFIAEVDRLTGIKIRVIAGTEEARLVHLAAAYGVDVGSSPACAVDIGGGSVEVTLGNAASMAVGRSFKTGVIRLTERFVKSDPLGRRDERRLVKHINREMGEYLSEIASRGYERVIGTSGTILSLGALALSEGGGSITDLRNRRVGAKAIRRLRKRLVEADLDERLNLQGLDPRRADLSVAGVVLLDTILKKLDAEELTLCDLALREGLVLDYIHRNRAKIRKADRYPDVRRRSIIELAERCRYWPEHAQQVARLAVSIFDQTRSAHGLGEREREWLEYGALLHDIGVHISYERHHRHSYYLIKNGDLRGFEPHETEIIALVARYHRQAMPKKSHEGYSDLTPKLRKTVKRLSAMVRLAEGLDRSHAQTVSAVDLYPRPESYLARLRTTGDAELEVWAAHRHVEALEQILGKPIRFELSGRPKRATKETRKKHGAPETQTKHDTAGHDKRAAKKAKRHGHAEQTDDAARVSRKAVRRGGDRRVGKDDAARASGQVA